MVRIFVCLLILTILAGCSASSSNNTSHYQMPPEMKDCKVFRLEGDGLSKTLYVVKCPNSNTSTSWIERSGKNNHTTYSVSVESH